MAEFACHCGAVRIWTAQSPDEVTECNCSICRRLAARWAYYTPAEVRMNRPGATEPYVWGERMLAFHRCRRCGCATHWQSLDGGRPRMALNARMMDAIDWSAVRIRQFDGAGARRYLEEAELRHAEEV